MDTSHRLLTDIAILTPAPTLPRSRSPPQANRWIKALETPNGLRSLKSSDPHLMRALESCVRVGSPVLLEDVGEALDPALDPLLQKQTFMQGRSVGQSV